MKKSLIAIIMAVVSSGFFTTCSHEKTTPSEVADEVRTVVADLEKELQTASNEQNDTSIVFDCFKDELDEHARGFRNPDTRSRQEIYQEMFSETELTGLLWRTKASYFDDLKWEFSVGGGFFFLPEASVKDSTEAAEIIDRTETMNNVLELIEARLFRHLRQEGIRFETLEAADYKQV